MALTLIERLGLYGTIFGISASENIRNHNLLSSTSFEYMRLFERFFTGKDDYYHAWLLFALVPLATSFSYSQAAKAVHEGLKARNKTTTIVQEAFKHLHNVQDLLQHSNKMTTDQASLRVIYGKAMRLWGSDWVLHVAFALFVELNEADQSSKLLKMHTPDVANPWKGRQSIVERYAQWLSEVETLGLLGVHAIKPLLKGGEIAEALELKPGRWTKVALEMDVDWQLLNWGHKDVNAVKAEIRAQKEKLELLR